MQKFNGYSSDDHIVSIPVCPLGVHCQVLVGLTVTDEHILIGLHIWREYRMCYSKGCIVCIKH